MSGAGSDTVRVAVWSGPRNISTAFMRSWENRPDTEVVDEPFYAAYLARSGADHPMREEVIASQATDEADVIAALLAPSTAPVAYSKQMAHHLADDADLVWTLGLRNVLLLRDPAEVVDSYLRAREVCTPPDIGVLQQARLAAYWADHGANVPVLDSADVLRDPEGHLRWLCDWLAIPFDDRMLRWPPGPRDSDGVWARHWYAAVWRSTGFEPRTDRDVRLSPEAQSVVDAVRPAYDALHARRLVLT